MSASHQGTVTTGDLVIGMPEAGARGRGDPDPLRVLVHDFAGHPFQLDLSRSLARRGHSVLHAYCDSYTSGKGDLSSVHGERLTTVGISVGDEFARYSPVRRARQEVLYGRRFVKVAEAFKPDVVLACNVPLLAQRVAARWFRAQGVPWIFWLQDLYSVALTAAAERKAGRVGRAIGRRFSRLEGSLLLDASQVVAITEDFDQTLDDWDIPRHRRHVVPNWAPLSDLPPRPRKSSWSEEQGLADRFTFLYSGTLGLKHRPELLYELAAQHVDDAEVVVISEGMGEERLRELLAEQPLPNLRLLPFQPFDRYPDIIGSADVLVALLEPAAGRFSVPSKVLSYLCAGRPILAAIPRENLAARTIEQAGAGAVVEPQDEEAFLLAAKRLRAEPHTRQSAGQRARAYAEATFDIEQITDRFMAVIDVARHREATTATTTRS